MDIPEIHEPLLLRPLESIGGNTLVGSSILFLSSSCFRFTRDRNSCQAARSLLWLTVTTTLSAISHSPLIESLRALNMLMVVYVGESSFSTTATSLTLAETSLVASLAEITTDLK